MKKSISILFIIFVFVASGPITSGQNSADNKLTNKEVKNGWKLLWDGKTTNGWISFRTAVFPKSGWEIKDGVLSVLPGTKESPSGGDIITTNKFKNFELSVDFMFTPGANSGIKYFVNDKTGIGCEFQILDDLRHPDAKAGINGNRTLAGLYDLIPPKPKKDNGPDKWNTAKIIVNGNHVEHWLNGQITVSYERGNPEWRALVATSKYKDYAGFGEASEGPILLQDHGDKVSFRNIRIREIK